LLSFLFFFFWFPFLCFSTCSKRLLASIAAAGALLLLVFVEAHGFDSACRCRSLTVLCVLHRSENLAHDLSYGGDELVVRKIHLDPWHLTQSHDRNVVVPM
jgi:hypothetical protein